MRVVVLCGGRSSEHDVSLTSGHAVAAGLREGGHDVEVVEIGRDDPDVDPRLGWPCWVKPARLGSSVGIARVERLEEYADAVHEALRHDPRVIVEAHAGGLEVECSVLGPTDAPRSSQPGEIVI